MKSAVKQLPDGFLEKLRRMLPSYRFDAVANTFAEAKPTTFRINRLKIETGPLKEKLEAAGFRLESVPWYREAFILKQDSLRDLQKTPSYLEGEIYVQNLSSMLPPLALDPQPDETILDLTAAPGSKTTQMAAMMKGTGRLVANDNNKVRFFKLKANVEQQGAVNVQLSLRYGESFGRSYTGQFDRVLLDAPCSAEGRFLATEPKTFGYWKPAKVKEMMRKQKNLMASAIFAVKPGGLLVYSTCTFSPEENEGVLDWALTRFGDQIETEAWDWQLPNRMAPLTQWDGRSYHPDVARACRILPTGQMEGFFLARLRRKKTHVIPEERSDIRDPRMA
jgi:16S rRNA (cytosine1407-C5)-methyltransferase